MNQSDSYIKPFFFFFFFFLSAEDVPSFSVCWLEKPVVFQLKLINMVTDFWMLIYISMEYNMFTDVLWFRWFIKSSGVKSIGAKSQFLYFPRASVSQDIGEKDHIYKVLRDPQRGWCIQIKLCLADEPSIVTQRSKDILNKSSCVTVCSYSTCLCKIYKHLNLLGQ